MRALRPRLYQSQCWIEMDRDPAPVRLTEREDRQAAIAALCASGRAELVQSIGKVALLYRKNPKPNRNLSNVIRYQG